MPSAFIEFVFLHRQSTVTAIIWHSVYIWCLLECSVTLIVIENYLVRRKNINCFQFESWQWRGLLLRTARSCAATRLDGVNLELCRVLCNQVDVIISPGTIPKLGGLNWQLLWTCGTARKPAMVIGFKEEATTIERNGTEEQSRDSDRISGHARQQPTGSCLAMKRTPSKAGGASTRIQHVLIR